MGEPPLHSNVKRTGKHPELLRAPHGAPGTPCTIAVLDTGLAPVALGGGLPHVAARPAEPWGPTKFDAGVTTPPHFDPTDNRDLPDMDHNDWLDPVAGHGTFIAGLLSRLAPNAEVTIGRVLENSGEGDDADIAYRINTLVDEGAPDVLVLSCSCYSENDVAPLALSQAVARIQHAGTVVVAAAGNDATCRVSWPAALPGVIAVGALGPDGPAPFTNFGSWVTACAPGVDVISNFFDDVDKHDDHNPATADYHGWARWSGTSFAAPIVAAAIAREASLYGISSKAAAERVVHDKRLYRMPGLGTVVNMH